MKKILFAIATFASISSAALAAQGNGDNTDADSRQGFATVMVEKNVDARALEVVPANDPNTREQHRLDEKNGSNS